MYVRVKPSAAALSGIAEGTIVLTVESPPGRGEKQRRTSQVRIPFKGEVIPTPPRQKRVLWDMFHSIRYPPMYIPRDNIDMRQDILDWHGCACPPTPSDTTTHSPCIDLGAPVPEGAERRHQVCGSQRLKILP